MLFWESFFQVVVGPLLISISGIAFCYGYISVGGVALTLTGIALFIANLTRK
jgi:hypothetical protein